MPHHDEKHKITKLTGEITHVFAHRFVVKTDSKDILADLTSHGSDIVDLHVGDRVTIEGEQKSSEIKIHRLERDGETFDVAHDPDSRHEHAPADPAVAVEAAKKAGYHVIGEARRKPKHFEVLGKKGSEFEELHIELNGGIRKTKPVSADDHKWQSEIEEARAA